MQFFSKLATGTVAFGLLASSILATPLLHEQVYTSIMNQTHGSPWEDVRCADFGLCLEPLGILLCLKKPPEFFDDYPVYCDAGTSECTFTWDAEEPGAKCCQCIQSSFPSNPCLLFVRTNNSFEVSPRVRECTPSTPIVYEECRESCAVHTCPVPPER
jgi:hypothetical protein